MKRVLLCVNSDIGRKNTIGFRFGVIASELTKQEIDFDIIARSNHTSGLKVTSPWYGNVLARFLNALHIYIFSRFNHRAFDVRRFDSFALATLQKSEFRYDVAHVGEYLPKTITFLKSRGTHVFLDVPIGHDAYQKELIKMGIDVGPDIVDESADEAASIEAADTLVVPSPFVSDTLLAAGFAAKEKVIIPFGVNMDPSWNETKIASRIGSTHPTFVFAGNINYRKGVTFLLEAWREAKIPNGRLILCGRVYKELIQEIKKYSDDSIRFVGFVDVREYFKEATVFVFPTLLEGSAKAVYEAMSYGLAVITTPNAGSIIKNGEDGYIIPIGDTKALVRAMKNLAENQNETLRLGLAAYSSVKKYSWETYGQNVVDHYTPFIAL